MLPWLFTTKVIWAMDDAEEGPFKPKGLARIGLFFDESGKLRVLDPEVQTSANQLAIECNEFIAESNEFKELVKEFASVIQTLSESVERAKIKALGSRNALDMISKRKLAQRQQIEAKLAEQTLQLERLRIQHESLVKQERELNDLILQLSSSGR